MKPGLYSIPESAYHAESFDADYGGPYLSHSAIVTMLQASPLHCWYAHPRLNPAWQAPVADKQMELGKAAHVMLLEPERFEVAVVVVDAVDWRTKAAQEMRVLARSEGKTPILAVDLLELKAIVASAREAIRALGLRDGLCEQTVLWEEDGTACKIRPDYLGMQQRTMLDYKLTQGSAKPEGALSRRIADMGYDVQAMWYRRGMKSESGIDWRFILLTQEWEPPYDCSLVELDPMYEDLAYRKCERGLRLWRKCLESGVWPGYLPQGIVQVSPPAYEMARWEEAEQTGDGLSFEERLLLGTQG